MRTVNRVASALLGLVALLVGVLVAVEGVLLLARRPSSLMPVERWNDAAAGTTLGDRRVLWASVIVLVVGLVVLAAQLRRTPPTRVAASPDHQPTWSMSRRRVEHRLADSVGGIRGVSHAKAVVRGNEHSWRVRISADAPPGQASAEDVASVAHDELVRLGADDAVPVEVSVRAGR